MIIVHNGPPGTAGHPWMRALLQWREWSSFQDPKLRRAVNRLETARRWWCRLYRSGRLRGCVGGLQNGKCTLFDVESLYVSSGFNQYLGYLGHFLLRNGCRRKCRFRRYLVCVSLEACCQGSPWIGDKVLSWYELWRKTHRSQRSAPAAASLLPQARVREHATTSQRQRVNLGYLACKRWWCRFTRTILADCFAFKEE
jgi:hypothetical protein